MMARDMKVCIGIDVGGTNTDAVVIHDRKVIAKSKHPTTSSVTLGLKNALRSVLEQLSQNFIDWNVHVCRINIGTTNFLNAVIQRKNLSPVAVVRLCGPASRALPPFCDFPEDLRAVVCAGYHFIDGGYEFDGKEIETIKRDEVIQVISQIKQTGTKHIVVSGIFSHVCAEQEVAVGKMIMDEYPEASFTLSHQVANLGLLERENSSILNESLKTLGRTAISAFTEATEDVGLNCPIFFSQNDGTIISAEKSLQFPVLTFSSGPTNSMCGAAFLSESKEAIVVDIGGTSTDVGVLVNGFPRLASTRVNCGGVVTNFCMPDVFSFALGGGSVVTNEGGKPVVGPDSVGYELVTKSLSFGGSTTTTTDFAVAAGLCNIGEYSNVAHLDKSLVSCVLLTIRQLLEDSIDHVKVKAELQPVILVGGGSVLVDDTKSLQGASVILKPEHFEVANAVGAAISQVSGVVDHVVDLRTTARDKALEEAQSLAIARAVENGAQPDTVVIMEKSEIQLAYLKGDATRVQIKAVGDLAIDNEDYQFHYIPSVREQQDYKQVVCAKISDNEKLLEEEKCKQTEDLEESVSIGNVTPFVEESSGAWILNEFDVECITRGAGILGCGGGGNPYLGGLSATLALKSGKEIRVIHPDSVPNNGLILPAAFMGAPSVSIETLSSGEELQLAAQKMQQLLACNETEMELRESVRGVKYVTRFPTLQSNVVKKIIVH